MYSALATAEADEDDVGGSRASRKSMSGCGNRCGEGSRVRVAGDVPRLPPPVLLILLRLEADEEDKGEDEDEDDVTWLEEVDATL